MSEEYPNKINSFVPKTNATYDGDPNGDYVMAEDINELQDGIISIEQTLGVMPQGNHATVKDRMDSLDGYGVLQSPSVFFYLGTYANLNGLTDEKKIAYLQKFKHIVLPSDIPDAIISNLTASSNLYGYIDTSTTSSSLTIGEIRERIRTFRTKGVNGIYCDNMGYDNEVSRRRQRDILDAIHELGMRAIVYATYMEDVMEANYHASMNEDALTTGMKLGDILHLRGFGVNTLSSFLLPEFTEKMDKVLSYRKTYHVQVMATSLIDSSKPVDASTKLFQYAHQLAVLYGINMFGTTVENNGVSVNEHKWYPYSLVSGTWKSEAPIVLRDNDVLTREMELGKLSVNTTSQTWQYEGSKIPVSHIDIPPSSIPGNIIQNNSIDDIKIKAYNGQRLLQAINADQSSEKLDIKKLATLNYTDLEGVVSVDALSANVIHAINAYIGTAVIDQAFIGDLHAKKITAGDIEADRITAGVIKAINIAADHAEIGDAYIHGAVIDQLNATSIKAGDIDADRIKANIIEAINFEAQAANIKNLNADNITTGNLSAERIQAAVINAINLYAESAVIDKAVIKDAAIGNLNAKKITAGDIEAERIQANIVKAMNVYAEHMDADSAKINTAVIGELDAKHIQANVIEAIHIATGVISADLGKIDGAVIKEGTIDSVQIADASITDAKIVSLTANKIKAGQIDTGLVTVQGPDGLLKIKSNRLQVFDRSAIPVERVSIGDVNGDGTQYGFRVRGADGQTVLYDEKGVYNEGITDGAITNPKIGDGEVDGRIIAAESVLAKHIVAETITGDKIKAQEINANHIQAGTITAGSAIIADASISNAQIGSIDATKITTGILDAARIRVGATTNYEDGYNPNLINLGLRDDLNLNGPLPTAITMGDFGFKAESAKGSVVISGDGMKITNGFLEIVGGLTEAQLAQAVRDKWNKTVTDIADMSKDNILTPSERKEIKDSLTFLLGTAPSGTTLPAITAIDSGTVGEIYHVRLQARQAKLGDSNADYKSVETKYVALKAYLETLSPRPWDNANTNNLTIVKADWDVKWRELYDSMDKLLSTTAKTINDNADNSIKPATDYNGVRIDSTNGVVITSSKNKTTLNATKGIEILRTSDNAVVFGVDSTTGNLTISGNINMQGGSISWDKITGNGPDYSKITGTKPDADATNTYKELTGNDDIKGMFIKNGTKLEIRADSITTGTMDAAKVKIINLDAGTISAGNLNVSAQQLLHETAYDFGTPKYWTASAPGIGGTWTVDVTKKFFTTNSIKVNVTGKSEDIWWGVFSEFIPVSPGEAFTLSANSFVEDRTLLDQGANLEIEWYNATTRIGTSTKSFVPPTNNTWSYFTVTGTAPANAVKARARFYVVRNGTIWGSRPMLQRGSVATQWQLHTDEDISVGAITADKIAAGSISAEHMTVAAREVGLTGHYYRGKNFENYAGQKIDPVISFDWGTGGPGIIAPTVDNFSVRWQGYLFAKQTGNYTIIAQADDGVRITLNNTVILDAPTYTPGDRSATVTLEANTWNAISIEYFEGTGGARMNMQWRPPWETSNKNIPSDVFRPGVTVFDGSTITTGKIKADLIQIGPDNIFNEGYDPSASFKSLQDPFFERSIMLYSSVSETESPPSLAGQAGFQQISGAGASGGSVLEMTSNKIIFSKNAIPIDVNKTYRMTFRVKQKVSNGNNVNKVFAGVATLDGNYKNLTGGAGVHRYFAADGPVLKVTDGWQTFTGLITGTGDVHTTFRAGTVYVRPMCIVNYQGDTAGVVQVDMLTFEDVTTEVNSKNYVVETANRLSTKGLMSTVENVSGVEKFLFHGYDDQGNPDKSKNGYLIVNGARMSVTKGYLTTGGATGYIMYDGASSKWYVASMDANKVWRRFNVGETGHNTTFIPNGTMYFVGYLS